MIRAALKYLSDSKNIFLVTVVLSVLTVPMSSASAGGQTAIIGPDPVQWAQEPHAYISTEVVMKAEPVESAGPVEYRFECTSGEGHSSDWQSEATYTDKNLMPEKDYTYIIQARDAQAKKELAPASLPVTVQTRRASNTSRSKHIEAIDKAMAAGEIEIIPLWETGDKDNRINIYLTHRWQKNQRNAYNKAELREEFIEDAKHVVHAFMPGDKLAVDPYPVYRNFFNFYAVWWANMPPNEDGGMNNSEYNEIRARLFLPWQREGKGWVSYLAMFNGGGGGGGAALNLEQRIGDAMIAGNEIAGFIHEFNHTAPNIPDEYAASGTWGNGGEGSNVTNEIRRECVRWRAWIDPDTPVPTPYTQENLNKIGLFEGGQSRVANMYRPTARDCLMGAGTFVVKQEIMCPICKQRAVCRFYDWVDPFDKVTPARSEFTIEGSQTVKFTIQRVKPDPDTQKIEWRLNDRVIAAGVDEVDVTFGSLAEYNLVCSITDESIYIRQDPPFVKYPKASFKWIIKNTQSVDNDNPLLISLKERNPVFAGKNDGTIFAGVVGGRVPYTFSWSDGAYVRDRRGLGTGTYTLKVIDSDFRTAEASITLAQEESINPQLRSTLTGNTWQITVEGIKGHPDITCKWSNGTTGAQISDLKDGSYSCIIRHKNGSEIRREVNLKAPQERLQVKIKEIIASSGGENNGACIFDVHGGTAPYEFIWSDGVVLEDPQRNYIIPGDYSVKIRDNDLTTIEKNVTIKSEPGFALSGLEIKKTGPGTVKITNPGSDYRYYWYEKDYLCFVPRFPHGTYTGTYATLDGRQYKAEAHVIQNKGGIYIGDSEGRSDFGYWIHLMVNNTGQDNLPETFRINTSQDGPLAKELTIDSSRRGRGRGRSSRISETSWNGKVLDGRIELQGTGKCAGNFELFYISRPEKPDKPLHIGDEFSPTQSGNYYIAAQKIDLGAMSLNRVGCAVTVGDERQEVEPLIPDEVKSAGLLMWLDASDLDGDGKEDKIQPRRGSVTGWQGKANCVNFQGFVFYHPNQQNGKGAASWKTIWLQSLSERVQDFQTIFMVRREHELSFEGTSPWRDLSRMIGVGEYGKKLMSDEISDDLRKGAVYLNGSKVDLDTASMPTGFYQITYEFPEKMNRGFSRTDGRWEGSIAECLVFDAKLSETERKGVEKYLRRKWISAVHLTN